MGKGKTVPKDGKGRTSKANNPPQKPRTMKQVVLEELQKHKERKENRRAVLDKFQEFRKSRGGDKGNDQ